MDELIKAVNRKKKLPTKYYPDCIYAKGVYCMDDRWCFQCGWNPEVSAQRAQKVRERLLAENES